MAMMVVMVSSAFEGDQRGDAIFSKKCKKRTNGESFVNLPDTSGRHADAADDDDCSRYFQTCANFLCIQVLNKIFEKTEIHITL